MKPTRGTAVQDLRGEGNPLSSPSVLVALDVGQTDIKARVVSEQGETLDLTLPGARTNTALFPQIAAAVAEVGHSTGLRATRVAVGSTGLTGAESDATDLLPLLPPTVSALLLAHDSVTSYLGARGARPGVVVAAGTGVVTLAVGRDKVARIDGWGHTMGDSGSGFWIGREALRAAMRAYDGRGPVTALLAVVRTRWPDLEDAYVVLQSDPDWVRTVAGFARTVDELAATDPVAADILTRAGIRLGHAALTGLSRVRDAGDVDPPEISESGNVFRSARVRAAFEQCVLATHPDAVFAPPAGTGIEGSQALAVLEAGHPLSRLISRATR